jgi:O-antigen ligase
MPHLAGNADGAATAADGTKVQPWLLAAATGATFLLPWALMYARAIGDGVLTVIVVLFLASRLIARDTTWLRSAWTRLALLFWGWMLLCTLLTLDPQPIGQAVAALRFFLLVPALESWVLTAEQTRRRLWYSVLAAALWILVECWQQYILGVNMFGRPRWPDGALTGPFRGPVAGPMFLWLFFPAFLPLCFLLLRRQGRLGRICGLVVPMLAAVTMILIGQRMPAVLMALGLLISGLLFRQFRLPVILTVGIGAALLALLPVVSPPAFAKLVVHFTEQMEHFWSTPYGLIFARAVTMVHAQPWLGLGWDGYRTYCMQPQYLTGLPWLPVSDPASIDGCTIHPHNYWLQIATSCGLPGVALFAALAAAWIWRIGGGTADAVNDRRAALLVIVLVSIWPIASTTSLFTVPNAGWFFLMAGWGLAEAGSASLRPVSVAPSVNW